MSKLFRGKFLHHLKAARRRQELSYHGLWERLREESAWQHLLNSLVQHDWVVYCKRPFGGPRQVLRYLARYTHRVAISDGRLQDVTHQSVKFAYKDYRDQGTTKSMTLSGEEFLRRFLLHMLPNGFMRIRYYGFLANGVRTEKLPCIREWLAQKRPRIESVEREFDLQLKSEPGIPECLETCRCPACGTGIMHRLLPLSCEQIAAWTGVCRAPPGEIR